MESLPDKGLFVSPTWCTYVGMVCRFLHNVKDSIKSLDISQFKSEMEHKINEMNNIINSQALTIFNQSSQLTDLQNCLDVLKSQLSSLSDDLLQMKECSNSADKELTVPNMNKKPYSQIWEPPSLKKDTIFQQFIFMMGTSFNCWFKLPSEESGVTALFKTTKLPLELKRNPCKEDFLFVSPWMYVTRCFREGK